MTDSDAPDTETDRTEPSRTEPSRTDREEPSDGGDAAGSTDGTDDTAERLRRYLNYALLAGLVLLAFVAALQFYLNAGAAINEWVAPEYRSLFQAAFNLAILLLAGAGLVRQLDRLAAVVGK